jgi:hypothetical protein
VPSFGGNGGIFVQERRFDEELVGILCQADNLLDIPFAIDEIDYVSDFLPARCADRVCF